MRVVALSELQQFAAVNLLLDQGAIGGPVLVPNAAQITVHWTLGNGKRGVNVLYGRYNPPFAGSVTQANSILSALSSGAAWTALQPFLSINTALASVSIKDVNTRDQAVISSAVQSNPGTAVGNALPDEVAAVLTEHTALSGRSNRGRIYLMGFGTPALAAGNVIAPTAVTALTNYGAAILAAINTNGYTMVIGQKARAAYTSIKTGVNHPARPANSNVAVTSISCQDNHWDTQRRRGLR